MSLFMCCWFCGGFVVVCARWPGLGFEPISCLFFMCICVSLRVSLHPPRFFRCSCSLAKPGKKPSAGRQTSDLLVKTPQWIPWKKQGIRLEDISAGRVLIKWSYNSGTLPILSCFFLDLPEKWWNMFVQVVLKWYPVVLASCLSLELRKTWGKVNNWTKIRWQTLGDLWLVSTDLIWSSTEETSTRASTTWATARLFPGLVFTCLLCTDLQSDLIYCICLKFFQKKPWMGDRRILNLLKSFNCFTKIPKLRTFHSITSPSLHKLVLWPWLVTRLMWLKKHLVNNTVFVVFCIVLIVKWWLLSMSTHHAKTTLPGVKVAPYKTRPGVKAAPSAVTFLIPEMPSMRLAQVKIRRRDCSGKATLLNSSQFTWCFKGA